MMASARHDNILIIGGGDGLALRDVLTWNPKLVILLDLDEELVDFFTHPNSANDNKAFIKMNGGAFSDPRVQTIFGDAWLGVDLLIAEGKRFDAIIVDLPDPNHPDLNKLYSTGFYNKLRHVLTGDGALVVQSTSPYHAKRTFLSIGKTIEASGFSQVDQYHANVPSFGEWGWTIAVPLGAAPKISRALFQRAGQPEK
jgi:spermidine synthase